MNEIYLIYAFILVALTIITIIFYMNKKYSLNSNYIQNDYYYINGIPNNVYITWSSLNVPFGMYTTVMQNINNNPEFNFYIYNDEMCADFIRKNFNKDILNVYNNLKPGAYKADLFRYCVLYINGGIYMDIKFIIHEKLKNLINNYGSIFVADPQPDPINKNRCKKGTFNGFIITKKHNPVFIDCINQIVINYNNKYYGKNSLYPTGPCLLGYIIRNKYPKTKLKLKIIEHITGYTINDNNDNIIISQYTTYRHELMMFAKTKHYSDLWKNNDIYIF